MRQRRTSVVNVPQVVPKSELPLGLAKLETARDLLLAAKTVDEAKELADKAAAAELWAKRSKLGLESQNYAAEIRLWAERRAGEILATLERKPTVGLKRGKAAPLPTPEQRSEYAQALEASRLTRKEAQRFEKVAKVPEVAFERAIAAAKEEGRELTTKAVLGSKENPASMQDRRTPPWLFEQLNEMFGPFKLDAFAEPHNALCERFYTKEQDGFVLPWDDVTFGNPEFEEMATPLAQAVLQAERGCRSTLLGPVGCAQDWYHTLAIRGTIYVPDRRISYDLPDGTPTNGADRDTIVMCFGAQHENPRWRLGEFRVKQLRLREDPRGAK